MAPREALGLLLVTLVVGVFGVWSVARGAAEKRLLVGEHARGTRWGLRRVLDGAPNRVVRRTAWGHRLENRLAGAGLDSVTPAEAVALAVALVVLTTALAALLVAIHIAALVGIASLFGLRGYARWREERQRQAFVAQMPELARVLSNATSAGLSIRTAIEMAGDELADPAKTELQRCARSMAVGTTLETALLQMEERVPGRELGVLVGTLVISARSGGSLIRALRDIATTLEDRRELRREVRTLLTQATYTGYLVVGMGVGLLFLLNALQPGLLRTVTNSLIGQAALAFAVLCFAVGLVLIRRMTRIES